MKAVQERDAERLLAEINKNSIFSDCYFFLVTGDFPQDATGNQSMIVPPLAVFRTRSREYRRSQSVQPALFDDLLPSLISYFRRGKLFLGLLFFFVYGLLLLLLLLFFFFKLIFFFFFFFY